MTSVLVVGDDPELRAALARDLNASNFEVHTAGSVEEAVAKLLGQSIDVLLTDLRIQSDRDGLELLRRAHGLVSQTRSVIMGAEATAQDYQAATNYGAVRVLTKPVARADLLVAIQEAVESKTGFRGNIHGLSLIDLLQMMHFARRSVTVTVRGPTSGQIHMKDGQIIDAESGGLVGEEALTHLLASPSGAIHTSVLSPRSRAITKEFEPLLLDLLRQIDERRDTEPESGFDVAFPVSSRRPNLALSPSLSPVDLGGASAAAAKRSASVIPAAPLTSRTPTIVMKPNPTTTTTATETISPPPPRARRMSTIDEACREVVSKVDGAVACGVVELGTRSLLGIYSAEGSTLGIGEALAAECAELFRGRLVIEGERLICIHRAIEDAGEPSFHEVHLVSSHNYHFAKAVKKGKAGIILVTKKTTNVGMGWAMLRSVIPLVEPHIPER